MRFVCDLAQGLPNDLRLIILGNYEILGKFQNWVKIYLSVQSPLQKQNFGNSDEKLPKADINIFWSDPILFHILLLLQIFCKYFVRNFRIDLQQDKC